MLPSKFSPCNHLLQTPYRHASTLCRLHLPNDFEALEAAFLSWGFMTLKCGRRASSEGFANNWYQIHRTLRMHLWISRLQQKEKASEQGVQNASATDSCAITKAVWYFFNECYWLFITVDPKWIGFAQGATDKKFGQFHDCWKRKCEQLANFYNHDGQVHIAKKSKSIRADATSIRGIIRDVAIQIHRIMHPCLIFDCCQYYFEMLSMRDKLSSSMQHPFRYLAKMLYIKLDH